MAVYKDVGEAINTGQRIVIGIAVIAVTLAIALFIVTQLNTTSGGVLAPAVDIITAVIAPISGGAQFLALAFLVIVAIIIIKVLQNSLSGE